MVGYYNAYKGSTRTPVIYAGNKIVKKVYKGSTLVYQIGFDTFTVDAGASLQAWTVPPGVTKIHVDCVASKGFLKTGNQPGARAGYGGRVQCDLSVTGGQVLYITVGAIPSDWNVSSYNASDIRIGGTDYGNRVIVAGGGGSGREGNARVNYDGSGGDGGGLIAGDGTSGSPGRGAGGTGGTQSAGGTGGTGRSTAGNNGSLGLGGINTSGGGGTGGAGYYGGGAGGYGGHDGTFSGAGGGGGSSYTNSNCSNVVHTQGYQDGAGYITISFVDTLGGD